MAICQNNNNNNRLLNLPTLLTNIASAGKSNQPYKNLRNAALSYVLQEVVVKLVNVSNGGNLDALRILHKIRVVPTFDPYGVLQFGAQSFLLERTYEENNISLERV